MKENIYYFIECNKCGKEFDYSKALKCTYCNEYQNLEDEDYYNGVMFPAHETWNY
jgi:hypothetical protein